MSFLICDPYLATDPAKPDSFVISGLGAVGSAPITSPAQVNTDATVQLHFDLSTIPPATYGSVTVKASLNGVLSASSVPIAVDTLPLTPSVPQNVRVSAT